jgi:hypothetical protein
MIVSFDIDMRVWMYVCVNMCAHVCLMNVYMYIVKIIYRVDI